MLGDNAWGQLSPYKDKFYVKPCHLDGEIRKEFFGTENVVYICGGGEFNLMLTAAGHVYGMGTTVYDMQMFTNNAAKVCLVTNWRAKNLLKYLWW